MCDPVTGGLILTAIGGGTKAINNNIALRRQDKANAQGIRNQSKLQRESNQLVNERVADIASSTGEAERAQALEGFLNTLRDASDTTGAPVDPLGLGGDRFAERVSSGEAETRKQGTERAGRLSKIDAAGRQRVRESERVAGTATDLGELARQSDADEFITRLRVASKRPNPIVNALADVTSGVGSVVGLGAGGVNLAKLAKNGTIVDPFTRLPNSIFGLGTPPILPA